MSADDHSQGESVQEPVKKPHDLIKRDDVEIALRADKGQQADLKSFLIKDFTSKGDNYACVVSSVEVQYTVGEKVLETSYVVKINPCRASFEKMTALSFVKETGFYFQILPLLNRELERVKERKLRTPQHFHSVERKTEEVIYLEDLRKSGYKLCDRKKGMSKAHTELILQELARLHAASVLLMSSDEYRSVDLVERFPVLKELFDVFMDGSIPMDMKDMMNQSLEQSAKIVELNDGYEYVAKYLRSMKDSMDGVFLEQLHATEPFKVICHGDCWNNNFLFRYDEQGNPVECRLLDLQITRVASPALDLNYMLYCSLNGDVRRPGMNSFFNSYYASFSSVLAGAGIAPNFTLPQFKEEFYSKNSFGLLMGMSLIPIVLMDSEDAPSLDDFKDDDMANSMLEFQKHLMEVTQRSPLLTLRFLSMFDEMTEAGLFEIKGVPKFTVSADDQPQGDSVLEPVKKPHDLIKRDDVEIALRADKGQHADLKSFLIKDFTSKGDNYACVVSSVDVQYKMDGKVLETSYVVKINPCRGGLEKMTALVFEKETGFYLQILPLLNRELERVNERKLRTAMHLYSVERKTEEVIYLEDLRKSGYKLCDRKKGMSKAHTELILEELARMHAASVLLMSSDEYRSVDLVERFPVLKDMFDIFMDKSMPVNINTMMEPAIEQGAQIAELNAGYDYAAKYLRSLKSSIEKILLDQLNTREPFKMICHGDCWNNNFLFRYDEQGNPVECRLLDLQVTRVASPALDLNYMLYCSLNGDVRRPGMNSFFNSYYASFSSVLAGSGVALNFTLNQLKQEFYSKNLFGLIMGMMLIPIVLMDSEDAPSLDDFKEEDFAKCMEEFHKHMMEVIQRSPLLTPRFLSMFDEMKETGLFETDAVSKLTEIINSLDV